MRPLLLVAVTLSLGLGVVLVGAGAGRSAADRVDPAVAAVAPTAVPASTGGEDLRDGGTALVLLGVLGTSGLVLVERWRAQQAGQRLAR